MNADIPPLLRLFRRRPNETFALATLVRTTGSSYRRPGARMLIAPDGERAGSLSAGCLEDEVAEAARAVIVSGEEQLLTFDTRRRFGCSGSLEILLERADNDSLAGLARAQAARQPFILVTAGSRQEIEPTLRLVVIGSGPDADALVGQATLLGWETRVYESIANCTETFDRWTAAIVATHNYGRDCAALRHLLPAGLRYLGLIGPRRRRDELLSDVLDSGAAMASELFAPAGLHLGADSPAEIALAVAAEIQRVFAEASALSLRERRAPIHALACPAAPQ